MAVLVRVEEAGLGAESQVRLVVSGVSDPARLRSTWASSGAAVELGGERLRATTTVEALARAAGRSLDAFEARALDRALRAAVAAWLGPARPVPLPGGGEVPTDRRPLVMGVLNVTPDSFSDGGVLYDDGAAHPDTAAGHAEQLVAEGADLLDVGGESTRPGAEPVPTDEELRRVVPVLERVAALGVPLSIDTTKPAVARAAVDAGAQIVNDVSGGREPELLRVAADSGAAYVLMHARGRPKDMQSRAAYADVVAEVYEYLAEGLTRCAEAGIATERVFVDPGIGFAKTPDHNLALLGALRQFRGLGQPILLGASRKSFIGKVLGEDEPVERLEGSLACAASAVASGVSVLRVHDVAPTVRVARMTHAIRSRSAVWPRTRV